MYRLKQALDSLLFLLAVSAVMLLFAQEEDVEAQSAQVLDEARVDRNVLVPMRDGVRLAADVYLPNGNGPWPVLLSRTPYNKDNAAQTAHRFVSEGYAVVVMDSRGIYGSRGVWLPYKTEALDGYDTQQWAGEQPWSNGKIGMFGTSYPGFTQLLPARFRSPYVKAIVPIGAQSDNFGSIWSTNGLYHLALAVSWGVQQEAIATELNMPNLNWMRVMNHLPLNTVMDEIGVHSGFVADTIRHESYDEFWGEMSIRDDYDEMDVPAFHVTGWYDDLVSETILNFTSMREHSRSEYARRWQKLLIGPWGHGVQPNPIYGDANFENAVTEVNSFDFHMKWFDYHLKGIDNKLDLEPPIRIFVMGDNVWRDEWEWPLARAETKTLYLGSGGAANTRFGDGILRKEEPEGVELDQYRYDPRNPVPTYGGHGCCGAGTTPDGPLDQRATQQRQDILVYTTEELQEAVEVTGTPQVRLFFSTDVLDTDFFVTLSDVMPDGRAILITEGGIRARFRNSTEKAEFLIPHQIYEVTIPMWETSNVFKQGHRIRLHVTSSNFPRFARNLNSGKTLGEEALVDIQIANQKIYHDTTRLSSLILPVIP